MSVKKPVVPAAAEAPAAEAKPARKTAKSAVKTEKAPKTEKTAHKGRPPLSPEIYVEFAGKQYNITDLVDRAKARLPPDPQGGRAVLQDLRQA